MPRYLIEREYGMAEQDAMQNIGSGEAGGRRRFPT